MPRATNDSRFIYGLHDPGGQEVMLGEDVLGWVLFTEDIGHDPDDQSGSDYTAWSGRGLGIIVRLNNGYYPQGTIPHSSQYENFARRCANFVQASMGSHIWVIGNEMNYAMERPYNGRGVARQTEDTADTPGTRNASVLRSSSSERSSFLVAMLRSLRELLGLGKRPAEGALQNGPQTQSTVLGQNDIGDPYYHGDPQRFNVLHELGNEPPPIRSAGGEVITPARYVACYRLCREAIQRVAGHEDDQVLVGAVAPWNNQTQYAGNPDGDWVRYFADILDRLGPARCDGFALHAYTHRADPNLLRSEATMGPPFEGRHYEFRAYQDFMRAVPANMRHLAAYITETDQDVPWHDANTGWVQQAYGEIDYWNQDDTHQQIRSMILYRWARKDRWHIEGKQGVIEDFRQAMHYRYQWDDTPNPRLTLKQGDWIRPNSEVDVRHTPGYVNQPDDDLVARLTPHHRLRILNDDYQVADGLIWWKAEAVSSDALGQHVWIAETASVGGDLLLEMAVPISTSPSGIELEADIDPANPDVEAAQQSGVGSDRLYQGIDAVTLTVVRFRRSPGYVDEPESDIIADVPAGARVEIVGGPVHLRDLTWWQVDVPVEGTIERGWMPASTPNGFVLLAPAADGSPPSKPPPQKHFDVDDIVLTDAMVRVRRVPGFVDKPEEDVIGQFWASTSLVICNGPESKDGLTWWQVSGITAGGRPVMGWTAQEAPNNVTLLSLPERLPGTEIPSPSLNRYLGAPFHERQRISQMWGENPSVYAQFTYDGVPLRGHNGLDFGVPTGTALLAVENGSVIQAHQDPGGYGHYVLLKHSWGQSLYAHLSRIGVQPGQEVTRGHYIGDSGNSGFSTGPHLHLAIRIVPYERKDGWGGYRDPLPYLAPDAYTLPRYLPRQIGRFVDVHALGEPGRGEVMERLNAEADGWTRP